MKKLSLLLIGCLFCQGLRAQDDLIIGKSRKFESRILGGEITWYEHLPAGYDSSGKTYPVVVMMNGQNTAQFAGDAATLDKLAEERVPDMILIGLSTEGAGGKYWSCPDDSGHVGGGSKYSAFLKEELMPAIEKNYRTNGYTILEGHSNSALFVIYQLLNDPDLFDAYIAASPMFGWCSGYFTGQTVRFLREHPSIRKKLYISFGDLDYVQVLKPMDEYREILQTAPACLSWKIERIENAGHVPLQTLNNALLFFFSGCTFTAERKKMSVGEIRSHFEALSDEYGFPVNPKSGALLDRAIDLNDENKPGQAIEWMNYLISLYPDGAVNYYCLGRFLQKTGDTESAKANYRKALDIDPGYEPAKKALEKMK